MLGGHLTALGIGISDLVPAIRHDEEIAVCIIVDDVCVVAVLIVLVPDTAVALRGRHGVSAQILVNFPADLVVLILVDDTGHAV